MFWIDGHIDLAYIAIKGRDIYTAHPDPATACITIPDLMQSPIRTFFGTIYTAPTNETHGYADSANRNAAFNVGLAQLDIYNQLEVNGLLHKQHVGCAISDTLSMLLTMEGADPIRNPEDVSWWKSQGLRSVGLTWSTGTRYAGGNRSLGPITDEGRDLIAALDESRIAHDISHLSDEAVETLFDISKGTIIASHSNSRSLLNTDSQRNLRDDHAIELLSRGGVIGLNLYTPFLAEEIVNKDCLATIDHCVEHIFHFCNLAGNNRQVALGSDFDGGFTPQYLPEGLKHPSKLHALAKALQNAGFSEEDLISFSSGAWQRIFN